MIPIYALALVLAKESHLALYLDGHFVPHMDAFFVDRMLQDPDAVEVRKFDRCEEKLQLSHCFAPLLRFLFEACQLKSGRHIKKPCRQGLSCSSLILVALVLSLAGGHDEVSVIQV